MVSDFDGFCIRMILISILLLVTIAGAVWFYGGLAQQPPESPATIVRFYRIENSVVDAIVKKRGEGEHEAVLSADAPAAPEQDTY